MKKPVLNLGCGNDLRGDIRIDLKPDISTALNLVADAHYLPLREKVIGSTLCKSVLEHVESPIKAILEMKRVTRNEIIIVVPNVINIMRIMRGLLFPMYKVSTLTRHLQGWDMRIMKHLAHMTGLKIESFTWFAKDPRKLTRISKPFFATHLVTTFTDPETCKRCGAVKKRFWCDPEYTYCPECDIDKECKK